MSPREQHPIDDLLSGLHGSEAPGALWDSIQEELAQPETKPRGHLIQGRPVASRWAAAASIVLAIATGGWIGTVQNYRAPDVWSVTTAAGAPTVDGASVGEAAELAVGEWLATDETSTARLSIGEIGTAEVRPNSRIRMEQGGTTEHRLTLAEGSIYAFVDAPPRLFFIETPTAVATDLGCAYILEVTDAGTTRIHVTSGWVEFRQGDRVSLVSAGLMAEVGLDGMPGTPYPRLISEAGRSALERLDRGEGSAADLETVIDAMYPAGLAAPARQPTTITLWHLLERLDGDLRARAFEALSSISPPPDGVTREGILALRRPMLERWRRDLVPMWADEGATPLSRTARRFWEWMMR